MTAITPAIRPAIGPAIRSAFEGGAPLRRWNLWQFTEDLMSNRYAMGGNAARDGTTISHNGITLHRLTASNFYSAVESNLSGVGITAFIPGRRYLLSFFVKAAIRQFAWMRPLNNGGSPGHGARLLDTTVRRIWVLAQASSTQHIYVIGNANLGFADNPSISPNWIFQGSTESGGFDLHIGGFQIEEVATGYMDGIAMIGDSTMQGAAGAVDSSSTSAREISIWLGALLNTSVYNRAVGGETTAAMDARWATSITTISQNCKYAVIQGGLNDLGQDRSLSAIQSSISSMVTKAEADGLLPVVFTCSPSNSIRSVPAREAARLALNSWMISSFPRTADIATVLADPVDPSQLNPAWAGDGVHYTQPGKEAVGRYVAALPFWGFTSPRPYQAVLGLP